MKKLILAGLLVALSSVAFADTFTLKNSIAPSIFYEVYISRSGSDDWSDELLGDDDVIEPGESMTFDVAINLNSTTVDIVIIDQMGNNFAVTGRRVRNGGTVTITINDFVMPR
ncbi:hypothetical protein FACS1894200_00950 [Spirochaetia bacterium]|nr:hypothetical protein FACS1894200_00950 [Spirochaetia bacterium]